MMNRRGLWALMAVFGLMLAWQMAAPSAAQAQLTDEEKEYLKEKTDGPSTVFLLAPRIRAVGVFNGVWGLFLDEHSSHWRGRANLGYGAEFVLRKPEYDLVFGFEWADLSMPDDWWLESGDPARKAEVTTFPVQLLSLTVGINWFFDISEVFGLYLGGGLGVGVLLGDIEKTEPSLACVEALGESKDTSLLDQEPCVDSQGNRQSLASTTEKEDRVPPVLPIINVAFGTQFTIAEHLVWRIETGVNLPYFYAGTSIGYQWW